MTFKTLWKIYSNIFGVSCYSLSTLLFKCSLSEKFLNKTQMPLWVKINKLNDNFKMKFFFTSHSLSLKKSWGSLSGMKFEIFPNSNIFKQKLFFGKSFLFPLNKTSKVKNSNKFHSINHSTINQTIIYFNYYNIPKFRILGCYIRPLKRIITPYLLSIKC